MRDEIPPEAEENVAAQLDRLDHTQLARECAKLDARVEAAFADEGLATDLGRWPAY